MYDVAVVGAGPGGLSASINASCEGYKTILLEGSQPGGQAGASSRIENYMGFPNGLSGSELTRRALRQTRRFGTDLISQNVVRLEPRSKVYRLHLADGRLVVSRTVVVATGLSWAPFPATGADRLRNCGVYNGAAVTHSVKDMCLDKRVYVVGAGNSAGQAALFLVDNAREVTMLTRSPLEEKASHYLIERLLAHDRISIMTRCEVIECHGEDCLTAVTVKSPNGLAQLPGDYLFVFVGSSPQTAWLPAELNRTKDGYLVTKSGFRTNLPGVFVIGDVRHGSLKRVAAASGEGAAVIPSIYNYLGR